MKLKVHNNFLEKKDFKNIQSLLISDNFPWYFNKRKVVNDFDKIFNFQFTHIFYKDFEIKSNYFEVLRPLINKLKPISIIRVKVNLTTPYTQIVSHAFHTDINQVQNRDKDIKVGIFYINTNNGKTIFSNKTEIESIENRFIEFPISEIHAGTTHTDTKSRIVLNINWI